MRALLVALFVLAPFAARGEDVPANTITITLRPSAQVAPGRPVTLGALADISGREAGRAAETEVATGPAPGRRGVVTREGVLRALDAAGIARELVQWVGAREVHLTAGGQPLDVERVRAAAEDLVKGAAPGGAAVTLVALRVPDGLLIEPGAYAVEVQEPPGGFRPGVVQIPVAVRPQSGPVRRLAATATIRMTGPVLVPLRDMPRGASLAAEDFRVEDRPLAATGRFLNSPASAHGRVAKVPLRAGQPVPASAVGKGAAVEPGQTVHALLKQGSVVLALQTICRGRGEVGNIVPISAPDGHRTLRARVLAPGKVQVLGSDELEGTASFRAPEMCKDGPCPAREQERP